MASVTKRVLVPVTWPAGRVGRGHLLPDLRQHEPRTFVRVPGGRPASHGMVAFVGEPVSAGDMLARWEATLGPLGDRQRAVDELEAYVVWVARQPLGAIFAASYERGDVMVVQKVADHLPTHRVPVPD